MAVYEYLTLTDRQASVLVDACQGVLVRNLDDTYARLDARSWMAMQLQDTDEEAAGLAPQVLALGLAQGEELLAAIVAYWHLAADTGLIGGELLSQVGLV